MLSREFEFLSLDSIIENQTTRKSKTFSSDNTASKKKQDELNWANIFV